MAPAGKIEAELFAPPVILCCIARMAGRGRMLIVFLFFRFRDMHSVSQNSVIEKILVLPLWLMEEKNSLWYGVLDIGSCNRVKILRKILVQTLRP